MSGIMVTASQRGLKSVRLIFEKKLERAQTAWSCCLVRVCGWLLDLRKKPPAKEHFDASLPSFEHSAVSPHLLAIIRKVLPKIGYR